MDIVNDLLSVPVEDAPVRSVLVGAHWTVVCSRTCGLASTLTGGKPHGHEKVRDVGRLHLKSARELAEYSRSDNLLEASIGVAALNSLLQVDEEKAVEMDAAEVMERYGRGKNIAIVGHFPFIPKLRPIARKLWVLERHPAEGEFSSDAAPELIPQADVVALTGSTVINHTLGGLLSLCRADALVLVLGPSTPLSPTLFANGASFISGVQVIDENAVLRTVGQGATFQQVEGVRRVTLARPGMDSSDDSNNDP